MASIQYFIYLNSFPVKTNIFHTTLVYNLKNNLKLASILYYVSMNCHIAPSNFVWLVSSCLLINTGLNTPSRERGNLTFKLWFNVYSFLIWAKVLSWETKISHLQWEKIPMSHHGENQFWSTNAAVCHCRCPVTAISFFWTWAESKCRRESVLMRRTVPLHTSLYFHDFPHVEMFGFSALLTCHVPLLNLCDCDKFQC